MDISSSVIGAGPDQVRNLSSGFTVGPGGNYASSPSASSTHLGPAVDQFQANQRGFLGFSFQEAAAGPTRYGWLNISINDTGTDSGTIHEWAYEDAAGLSLPVGVPEPSGLILLLLGMGSLGFRRFRPR